MSIFAVSRADEADDADAPVLLLSAASPEEAASVAREQDACGVLLQMGYGRAASGFTASLATERQEIAWHASVQRAFLLRQIDLPHEGAGWIACLRPAA
jgi:hypothetical protein